MWPWYRVQLSSDGVSLCPKPSFLTPGVDVWAHRLLQDLTGVLNPEQREMCTDQHFCLGFMASMVKKPFILHLSFLPK